MINKEKLTQAISEVLRRHANNTAKSEIFSTKIEALKVALKDDPRALSCYGIREEWPTAHRCVSNS
ncbi:hypothetical protein [Shewanella sp. 1180_01]|uniref:hypothetical protein n=1 Tax=Shewanella sp. 1180_01 TaxID=2604451 RepID=UPI0040633ACE